MSYLFAIMEFFQKYCDENSEIAKLFNDIDGIQCDNNEMETQLQELDREHVRLEMELCNVELLTSKYDNNAIEKCNEMNMRIFELSVDIRNLISKIDFVKILKCHYMEMEEKCRKECEPLQEYMVKTAKWHEKMEQRHVVQKYRQAEVVLKESESSCQKQQESMTNSFKEGTELINNATQRRNEIIVNFIKESNDLKKLKEEMKQLKVYEEHLEGLKKQKMDLGKQLELSQHKTFNFNPIVPYKSQDLADKSSENLKNFNFAMPKLPSFTDILTAFQTKCETKTEIMVIQNTTCIKSILHNSQNNSMELNQSITTKLTKQVRFRVPLEEFQEDVKKDNSTDDIESETSSQSSQQTIVAINEFKEEDEEMVEETEEINKETELEIIDLLTPAEKQENMEGMESPEYEPVITEETEKENLPPNKPKIEIQECIIFKAPLPVAKLEDKENLKATSNSYKILSSDEPMSSKDTTLKSSTNSFYDEFLKASLSSDFSPSTTSQTNIKTHSKRSILKDFDKYLNETKDFSIDSKQNSTPSPADQKGAEVEEEIFDFGSNNKMGFAFDSSDDNMGENNEHNDGNVFDFF